MMIILFIAFLVTFGLEAVPPKLMLITIPKSGTHLLEKCVYLMDSKHYPYNYNEDFYFEANWKKNKDKNHTPPHNWKGYLHPTTLDANIAGFKRSYSVKNNAYHRHIYYTQDYNDFLDVRNFKKILLLRDPRAVVVSFANMVKDGFEPHHKIAFNDLLLDLIDGRQKHYIPWASSKQNAYPFVWEVGICDFYKLYLPFITSKNCLTVRFEDLVGAKGGGSDELQAREIKRIAQHLGITINDKKINKIREDLFGNTTTFHQGTIDGWKKYFTPDIKKAFRAVRGANELLVDLGYEKKTDW